MIAPAEEPVIGPVDRSDLDALHAVATASLPLDRFSRSLLERKLFENPRPSREQYAVYAARQAGETIGFMQSVVRPDAARAWMGMFAVAPPQRRRGVATALYQAVRRQWAQAGAKEAEVLAIPGNYFNPGIDPRYTPALCFVEHLGFERFKDCANMTAHLRDRADTRAEEQALAERGVEIRLAAHDDARRLDAFFEQDFGADWRMEAGLAMQSDPPTIHLAMRDGRIIAFSAHSTQNQEWGFFGPMGTTPACRGLGVGRILLLRCLNDLRDAGHRTAVIPWVGPIGFYSRYCDGAVERVFWRYRRTQL